MKGFLHYQILRCLDVMGPLSGPKLFCCLEQTFERDFTYAQERTNVYVCLQRMAGSGLIRSKPSKVDRRENVYTINARGRKELNAWVKETLMFGRSVRA